MSIGHSQSLRFSDESKSFSSNKDFFPNNSGPICSRPRFNSTQPSSELYLIGGIRKPESFYGDLPVSSGVSQNSNSDWKDSSQIDFQEYWESF